MGKHEIIHHYTTINTLALILKNKTIRLNRLDRVDDLNESRSFGEPDVSKYLFVSCWTDTDTESIPQWHIYTDAMRGVRISLNKDMFFYRPLELPNIPTYSFLNNASISPIPYERMITDDYFVLPTFLTKEQFERKVEYVNEPNKYYKNIIESKITTWRESTTLKTTNLAKYKHIEWAFQSEFRFVLIIIPQIVKPMGVEWNPRYYQKLIMSFGSIIRDGKLKPTIDYFDVDIDPKVLDNITVTLGPCTTEGDRLIVESLLKQYTQYGELKMSELHGTIRCKNL